MNDNNRDALPNITEWELHGDLIRIVEAEREILEALKLKVLIADKHLHLIKTCVKQISKLTRSGVDRGDEALEALIVRRDDAIDRYANLGIRNLHFDSLTFYSFDWADDAIGISLIHPNRRGPTVAIAEHTNSNENTGASNGGDSSNHVAAESGETVVEPEPPLDGSGPGNNDLESGDAEVEIVPPPPDGTHAKRQRV